MPREKEFEPKEALEKAMRLFWQKGYFDTSLEDLVAQTGVSRYGIYATFGDKHEFFIACLKHYRTVAVDWLLRPMEAPDASLAEIRAYFETLTMAGNTPTGRMGCLICNTATELSPFDRDAAKQVNAMFERMRNAFRNSLNNARNQGKLASRFDVDAYADYLTGIAQGLFVLIRSSTSRESIQRFSRVALEGLE